MLKDHDKNNTNRIEFPEFNKLSTIYMSYMIFMILFSDREDIGS